MQTQVAIKYSSKTMSANILLVSDVMIKERTAIHGNIDPKNIYPDIKVAQDMYILPILGSALFNKMQAIVSDDTINTDGSLVAYKTMLDKYLCDALIYYTLSELPTTISYQFWNKGVLRKSGENTELPSMSELIDLSNKYKNRAEFYAQRLRLYVVDQAAKSKFPEYNQPGNTIDTVYPNHRAFTNPIYLSDEGRNPFCNPGGFTNEPYHG
jgi:hypothetical protein